MEAAAAFSAWSGIPEDAVLGTERMNRILRDISDVSMPRKGLSRRPATYWWNQEIADLRRSCNACRRRLMRARAKRSTSRESLRELWDALREARRSLRRAIVRSKIKLWAELVDDLDRDPPRGCRLALLIGFGGGVVVSIGSAVKYLGLTLNSRWTFRDHFRLLLPKAWGMAMALVRLTANIGGPGERRRRLYATAVMSVVLYGAPIWAQTVAGDREILRDVRRLQRQLALRIIRGYRTFSHKSEVILSGMVPFDIVANRLRRSYLRRRMIITRDGGIAPRVSSILVEERRRSVSRWRERLVDLPPGCPGAFVRGAFLGDLGIWTERAHGALTYRITQVLTGHRVFESYLHKIRRRESPICLFCRAAVDTAAHTLLFCPAWAERRSGLLEIVGVDRTFRTVVRAIVRSPEAWSVFADFCEVVMRKEEDECSRERELNPPGGALISPSYMHSSDEEP
ncbi:PO14 protein, partial [Pseudoatta argentina]